MDLIIRQKSQKYWVQTIKMVSGPNCFQLVFKPKQIQKNKKQKKLIYMFLIFLKTAPYSKDDKCLWDPRKVNGKDCKSIFLSFHCYIFILAASYGLHSFSYLHVSSKIWNSPPDTYKTWNFLEFKQEILRYEAFPQ